MRALLLDVRAEGVELSYEFQYHNDSRTQLGAAVTDADGEAIIAVPPPSPGDGIGEFRFSLTSAHRRQRRLQLGGKYRTGWVVA